MHRTQGLSANCGSRFAFMGWDGRGKWNLLRGKIKPVLAVCSDSALHALKTIDQLPNRTICVHDVTQCVIYTNLQVPSHTGIENGSTTLLLPTLE